MHRAKLAAEASSLDLEHAREELAGAEQKLRRSQLAAEASSLDIGRAREELRAMLARCRSLIAQLGQITSQEISLSQMDSHSQTDAETTPLDQTGSQETTSNQIDSQQILLELSEQLRQVYHSTSLADHPPDAGAKTATADAAHSARAIGEINQINLWAAVSIRSAGDNLCSDIGKQYWLFLGVAVALGAPTTRPFTTGAATMADHPTVVGGELAAVGRRIRAPSRRTWTSMLFPIWRMVFVARAHRDLDRTDCIGRDVADGGAEQTAGNAAAKESGRRIRGHRHAAECSPYHQFGFRGGDPCL